MRLDSYCLLPDHGPQDLSKSHVARFPVGFGILVASPHSQPKRLTINPPSKNTNAPRIWVACLLTPICAIICGVAGYWALGSFGIFLFERDPAFWFDEIYGWDINEDPHPDTATKVKIQTALRFAIPATAIGVLFGAILPWARFAWLHRNRRIASGESLIGSENSPTEEQSQSSHAGSKWRISFSIVAALVASIPFYGFYVSAARDSQQTALVIFIAWFFTWIFAAISIWLEIFRPSKSRAVTTLSLLTIAYLVIAGVVGAWGVRIAFFELIV